MNNDEEQDYCGDDGSLVPFKEMLDAIDRMNSDVLMLAEKYESAKAAADEMFEVIADIADAVGVPVSTPDLCRVVVERVNKMALRLNDLETRMFMFGQWATLE